MSKYTPKKNDLPNCTRNDCAFNREYHCTVLTECMHKNGYCPFFKTELPVLEPELANEHRRSWPKYTDDLHARKRISQRAYLKKKREEKENDNS